MTCLELSALNFELNDSITIDLMTPMVQAQPVLYEVSEGCFQEARGHCMFRSFSQTP